jgi:hypothetical protein
VARWNCRVVAAARLILIALTVDVLHGLPTAS